jgi:4-hydroxy-2-oxoheptanedioate aldolase
MKENKVKAKLAAGEPVFGSMVLMLNPAVVAILAHAGYDFVCLDGEHGALDRQLCEDLVRAAECADIVPIFRMAIGYPAEVLPYLDTGIAGIKVPHVNTAEDAQRAVDAVKYAPLGKRGMTPGRANAYAVSGVPAKEYIEASNRETLIVVQIEEVEGVENIEEIVQVEGIDVFFIGTGDLSQSAGYPGQREHPEVLKLVDRVIQVTRGAGKVAGYPVGNAEAAKRNLAKGVLYFEWGDGRMFYDMARGQIDAMRGS